MDMEKEAVEEIAYSEGKPVYEEGPAQRPRRRGQRGVTLAIIMIGAGVAILLSSLGIISFSWSDLFRYWPVLLILVGLDIILGGRSAFGSLLLAGVAIAVIAGLIFWADALPSDSISGGPSFGGSSETINASFAEPLGNVNAVDTTLELGIGEIYLEALEDSSNVVEGEYSGPGWLSYNVDYQENNGEGTLVVKQEGKEGFNFPDGDHDLTLDLFLTGLVPMDLTINPGVSEADFDLSGLDLTSLDINGGVGEIHITLPEDSQIETVDVEVGVGEVYLYPPGDSEALDIGEINVSGGVGSFEVELPEQGDFTLDINVGVGSIYVDVPDDLEVRIEVQEEGLTDIEIGDRYQRVGDGIWESGNYDGADNRVLITIEGGVGSVDIDD
jgi:hypothetical protein